MDARKFALVVDGVVVNIVDVNSQSWLDAQPIDQNWIEYSSDNEAYIGGEYVDGFFYNKPLYANWTKFEGTWQAPTPKPVDDFKYEWDEETNNWKKLI